MSKMSPPLTGLQLLRNVRTRQREKIFFHRLAYDLQIAGVMSNRRVQVYEVDVDDAGYDIIVDDGMKQRRFQVKTRFRPGGAHGWECHSALFCPTPEQGRIWEFQEWNLREAWGFNGGLIVADIQWPSGEVPDLKYWYCDLATLMALRDGFSGIASVTDSARNAYRQTLHNPFAAKRRMRLPQALVVAPNDHVALLTLMGFVQGAGADYVSAYHQAYSRRLRGHIEQRTHESYKATFFKVLTEKLA